ncbi:ABC transporter ATP-binding protein [Lichenihabitans psoromatis]|uniref:ABC transporter ATP-binding protein n=1 Tax=Lichenihabitans psoromatis TaxID=2528642 RepID=UPI001038583B|nr:ATP-binding cassette domain-containing protein [Lichenihabitans psoromatis]
MSLAPRQEAVVASPTKGVSIAVDRIGKSFEGTHVLSGLSLHVPAGQFLAIVGRSGSGKSTLLRLICGLDQPTTGRLTFDGGPAQPGSARIMFQEPRLLPWARVLDNVAIGLKAEVPRQAGRSLAIDALRAVGLEARAQDWPTVLSGGQKQRVALARALVSRPGLLLLDEPLGALDALTRLEMQTLLADVWTTQGFTAVLVTHDVAEAVRLADRIIVLQDGAITLDVFNAAPRPRSTRHVEALDLEERLLTQLMST